MGDWFTDTKLEAIEKAITEMVTALKELTQVVRKKQTTWFYDPSPAPWVPQPYYPTGPTWISEIPGIPLGGHHTYSATPEPCHQLSFSYEEPQLREQLLHQPQTHLNTANTEEQNQTWETPMANG
jgi:hypothetical protein